MFRYYVHKLAIFANKYYKKNTGQAGGNVINMKLSLVSY